jgi:hypothetical protein
MVITKKMLNDMLDKKDTDILIKWDDTPTIKTLLKILYEKNYDFICGFHIDLENSCSDIKCQVEQYFYKFYHGNSNIYLHIFYNPINGKNEIQFTNLTNIKSYPQYKNKKYYLYFG